MAEVQVSCFSADLAAEISVFQSLQTTGRPNH